MFKIIVLVALMCVGSTVWGSRISCESCGNECVSACGTKQFRACCFNYLKKKRSSVVAQFTVPKAPKYKPEGAQKQALPYFIIENVPEETMPNLISSEYKPFFFEDYVEV